MVCAKLWIPVIHLEAGLRSFDRKMPEEINRLVTDAICDVLWTPSQDGTDNLLREGVAPEKIECIGNIMLDSFEMMRFKIEAAAKREELGLPAKGYALVTLHRPSNVDAEESLKPIVEKLIDAATKLPVVFSTHPRTIKKLQEFGLHEPLSTTDNLQILEPTPYVQFMSLVADAQLVITDSGGIQEETTYLGIPCLTLRDNTERPITVSDGTNKLVNVDSLTSSLQQILAGEWPKGHRPELWDGQTANRAVESLRIRAGF
jgi:UDP-N-acetylglucosamine 2-epimerase (non-hydrolysing)